MEKLIASIPECALVPLTKSEQLVSDLCEETFLSLWSYPNPRRLDKQKELCDALVACDPDLVIFSVKEIGVSPAADNQTAVERWQRRSIDGSVRQIYGAERTLGRMEEVVSADGLAGLKLPPLDRRRVHRIAVVVPPSKGITIPSGDFGKGFVHVYDDRSLAVVMQELDTISDFLEFLRAVEDLHQRGVNLTMFGSWHDLLGFYLVNERRFPQEATVIILEQGIWSQTAKRPEMKRKKRANEISQVWDRIIEDFARYLREGTLGGTTDLNEVESGLRIMARETRYNRRVLSKQLWEVVTSKAPEPIRSRTGRSPSGIAYVFLACPSEMPRSRREDELRARCFLARGMNQEFVVVLGIATERLNPGGLSFDLCVLDWPEWTPDHQRQWEEMTKVRQSMSKLSWLRYREEEFPTGDDRPGTVPAKRRAPSNKPPQRPVRRR